MAQGRRTHRRPVEPRPRVGRFGPYSSEPDRSERDLGMQDGRAAAESAGRRRCFFPAVKATGFESGVPQLPTPLGPFTIMRVLLVEDDEDLRYVISAGLRDAGYAVDAVSDWPDADLMLDSVPYSCVVLDRMVPSGDTLHPLRER